MIQQRTIYVIGVCPTGPVRIEVTRRTYAERRVAEPQTGHQQPLRALPRPVYSMSTPVKPGLSS